MNYHIFHANISSHPGTDCPRAAILAATAEAVTTRKSASFYSCVYLSVCAHDWVYVCALEKYIDLRKYDTNYNYTAPIMNN